VPRVYTWSGSEPSRRNLTLADLRAAKGRRQFTQVSANTTEEAEAAREAGIDLLICGSGNVAAARKGNDTHFLTAGIPLSSCPTPDDMLREAFRAMELGADAVFTQRSLEIVSMLAKEGIPVMGHLGLVPRKSTWVGGLRAIGKTAAEAQELFTDFRRLEEAGAALVESELIAAEVLAEITKRSGLITVSLGSGGGADVTYLFMNDICGEQASRPRHARAYGDLLSLQRKIKQERISALKAFRTDVSSGAFPGDNETVHISSEELEKFRTGLNEL
jgi:3-methyl-2-oxobutanoate hydroxymethyltransferase